jgi:hypothetical protein
VDVDGGENVLLDQPLGDDDRVLEVVALPRHEGDEQVRAERELAHVGRAAVGEDLLRTHPVTQPHDRLLVDQGALVRAHELGQRILLLALLAVDEDAVGVDVCNGPGLIGEDHVARVDGGAVLETGADERRLRDHQRHGLPLHVRAHQRAVRVVVLEERDQRGRDRDDLRRGDVHEVDVLGARGDGLSLAGAAEHHLVHEAAGLVVDLGARLGDRVLRLLGGVQVNDLLGHLPVRHLPVRRLHEAELRDGGERRQRPHQADVRALRSLDRAHSAVMRRVHVAHLDRRALAREAAGAERREPPPVREPGERVRLVHELRELRRAEELLQRRHDRADVDDRLRRDRVHVLRGHPLADDALHPVEPDAEGLLDQLANCAQPAVAEVLVLVELAADLVAREHDRVGGEVLGLGVDAEHVGQLDQLLDEREDVLRRQHAHVVGDVHAEPLVQLVPADLRQVVALRVEEQRLEQVPRVVERRRLTGALLLEDLDQRFVLARRGVLLERVRDVDRIAEQLHDRLVRAGVELPAGRGVLVRKRAQQRRDRELPLPVDACVHDSLLVDLELEPRATRGHQVRREDLLRRVLRLHQVRPGRAHELRHDHALGAVDDERAPLGHHREVAHEDRLLADLARLLVDEADRHRERSLVGQVLLPALLDSDRGIAELVLAEFHGERAGVVLDRGDVVDRLPQALVQEPLERGLLDVDQVRKVEYVLETRKALARARRSDPAGQVWVPPLTAMR